MKYKIYFYPQSIGFCSYSSHREKYGNFCSVAPSRLWNVKKDTSAYISGLQ
jgi:hypothetical protein